MAHNLEYIDNNTWLADKKGNQFPLERQCDKKIKYQIMVDVYDNNVYDVWRITPYDNERMKVEALERIIDPQWEDPRFMKWSDSLVQVLEKYYSKMKIKNEQELEMAKYIRKPIEIEAIQYTKANYKEILTPNNPLHFKLKKAFGEIWDCGNRGGAIATKKVSRALWPTDWFIIHADGEGEIMYNKDFIKMYKPSPSSKGEDIRFSTW